MVGGQGQHQQVDGDKFVCLDPLLAAQQCLIYSFGLASDWTFEDQMDRFGCSIFAYDHTISAPAKRGRNIHFFKTGLGIGRDLKTLKEIIEENNHQNRNIHYLKVRLQTRHLLTLHLYRLISRLTSLLPAGLWTGSVPELWRMSPSWRLSYT